jgi:hypothetical protein
MSTLSIHKLPPQLEKAMQNAIKTKRITKTEIVIRALENFLVVGSHQMRLNRLKAFFADAPGVDLKAFKKRTQILEKIDQELWS